MNISPDTVAVPRTIFEAKLLNTCMRIGDKVRLTIGNPAQEWIVVKVHEAENPVDVRHIDLDGKVHGMDGISPRCFASLGRQATPDELSRVNKS